MQPKTYDVCKIAKDVLDKRQRYMFLILFDVFAFAMSLFCLLEDIYIYIFGDILPH